ncbi:hypothetical protein N9051_01280 [Akkermansiaceae bacterium]|nr:hypothetical protein [Akkermansiaceae bacterium]
MMRWLLLFAALYLSSCDEGEYTEEEIPTGYIGEARLNPYLAATRFLNDGGWSARSERVWSDFGYETSTIVVPASFLTTKGIGMRALEWVEEGGLLVITMEGGEAEINDFQGSSFWSYLGDDIEKIGLDYLLQEVGVEVTTAAYDKHSSEDGSGHMAEDWNVAEISLTQNGTDHDLKVEFQGEVGMKKEFGDIWEDEKEASRMMTAPHGVGTVMILSHARPFRNAYVDHADHALFLEVLADWNNDGDFIFLYGSGTSFFELLWQHAWQAVVAGLLLLFCWLWKRIPRFGPVKEDDFTHRRSYGDGLKAAATFLWRRNTISHYLNPIRAELQGDSTPDEVREKLSRESGLSAEEVTQALYSEPTKDPNSITKMVRQLQLLLKR